MIVSVSQNNLMKQDVLHYLAWDCSVLVSVSFSQNSLRLSNTFKVQVDQK